MSPSKSTAGVLLSQHQAHRLTAHSSAPGTMAGCPLFLETASKCVQVSPITGEVSSWGTDPDLQRAGFGLLSMAFTLRPQPHHGGGVLPYRVPHPVGAGGTPPARLAGFLPLGHITHYLVLQALPWPSA